MFATLCKNIKYILQNRKYTPVHHIRMSGFSFTFKI